jgi:hypothetical protein
MLMGCRPFAVLMRRGRRFFELLRCRDQGPDARALQNRGDEAGDRAGDHGNEQDPA